MIYYYKPKKEVFGMKKIFMVSLVLIAFVFICSAAFAADKAPIKKGGMPCQMDATGCMVPCQTMTTCSQVCVKTCASGKNINDTPSIKSMQSQPCPKRSKKTDVLGCFVPTQTDNSSNFNRCKMK
jgi:hypothetical protein